MPLNLTKEEQNIIKAKLASGELTSSSPEYKQMVVTRHDIDALLFARSFLKEHMRVQSTGVIQNSPPFHAELIDLYQNHRFVAVAAPRGHAKSTVTSLFYVIHAALYLKKKNIVLISASEDMAKKFLRRVRDELEYNKLIMSMFGIQQSAKWSETEIKLSNGVAIYAKGREAQLRGLIDGANRPDLIIFDDIEDDEMVRSQLRRQDLEEWFNSAALPSLDPSNGQVIFIGTILHEDSLLSRLLDPAVYPDFVSKRYAALFTDPLTGEELSLWPERFPKEELNKKKESYIARGKLPQFYMEYLNNPIPTETATFKREYFRTFVDLPDLIADQVIFEVFIDLGGGSTRSTADFTAIVVLAIDKHNNIYVHDYVNKRMGPDVNLLVDELMQIHAKYRPHKYTFEKTVATNMIESTLKATLLAKNVHLNIEYITPTRGSGDRRGNMSDGKYQRIIGMEAAFKLGVIRIRPWMTELMDQLLSFPRSSHDDLLDALAYGYQLLIRRKFHEQTDEEPEPDFTPIYADIGL